MNILLRGLLLIAIPTLFQLLFLGMLLKGDSDAVIADHWALHSKEVIQEIMSAEEPVLREAGNLRLAVITDDRNDHAGAELWKEMDQRMSDLAESVSDNKEQVAKVLEIASAIQAYRQWNQGVDQKIGAGAHADAVAEVRTGRGSELISQVMLRMGEFLNSEKFLDAQRTADVTAARSKQKIVLLCSGLFAVLAGAGAAFLFSRGISNRISVLTHNASLLGKAIPLDAPVTGNDEIATLDRALHDTAGRLMAADEAERRLQTELRSRAEELAKLNDDLRLQTQENELFVYSVSHDLRSPLVNLRDSAKSFFMHVRT